jgi:hypothetical protein
MAAADLVMIYLAEHGFQLAYRRKPAGETKVMNADGLQAFRDGVICGRPPGVKRFTFGETYELDLRAILDNYWERIEAHMLGLIQETGIEPEPDVFYTYRVTGPEPSTS